MRHASLFAGIGGFDLAAQWAGWTNVFHCEKDKFCQQILKYYWPEAKLYEDIIKANFTRYKDKIDILTGGFPCQPFSAAGLQRGTSDARYLWPEMLRSVREIRPRWVIGENVKGLLDWQGGMVLDQIKTDLEREGYEVFRPYLLPACSVGAPHKRYRVFIIAHAEPGVNIKTQPGGDGKKALMEVINRQDDSAAGQSGRADSGLIDRPESDNDAPDPDDERLQRCKIIGGAGESRAQRYEQPPGFFRTNWEKFPTEPPLCAGDDGLSERLDGLTFSKWRNESLKAAGNAVVPQLVLELFKAIEHCEKK